VNVSAALPAPRSPARFSASASAGMSSRRPARPSRAPTSGPDSRRLPGASRPRNGPLWAWRSRTPATAPGRRAGGRSSDRRSRPAPPSDPAVARPRRACAFSSTHRACNRKRSLPSKPDQVHARLPAHFTLGCCSRSISVFEKDNGTTDVCGPDGSNGARQRRVRRETRRTTARGSASVPRCHRRSRSPGALGARGGWGRP
jgi:hypothetical protein